MMLYAFYNADLINIAKGKFELSTGFVDDCAFVAVENSLGEVHLVLKNMMECTGSGLEWSLSHNSPFKLSKIAVMDFTRTPCDTASTPLQINKLAQTTPRCPTPSHLFPPTSTWGLSSIPSYHGTPMSPKSQLKPPGGHISSGGSPKQLEASPPTKPISYIIL